ncbi:MAG: TIGR03560 family F420-dependent LLM class oxidoreductase, partial [Actinomycetota bacterium]
MKLPPVFDYPTLERFWRDADELGFHAVWDYDHFYGLRDPIQPTLEGWTLLGAMAKATSRVRIGCMVTGLTYRHPAVLANMATTVDHISDGRLDFGIGAAWYQVEHDAYGIEFPPVGTRIAMLDEACTLIRRMWTEDRVDHQGRFWTLADAMSNPKPIQPRVPMVIGGAGEKRTLRVVATHADEWNWSGSWDDTGPEEFARLSGILDEHCAAVGREPKVIRRSFQLFVEPQDDRQTKDQVGRLDDYAAHGADHVVFVFVSPPSRAL